MFTLKIKELRIAMGLSQKEVGERAGLSQMYISYLERPDRKKSPTLKQLEKLGKVFGVCPLMLLEYTCEDDDCKKCKRPQK